MIKGLYTAASGMMLQMARQDNAANNLANVNTSGYKKDNMVSESFPGLLISRMNDKTVLKDGTEITRQPFKLGPLPTGAVVAANYTDWSAGMMQQTGNYTDLAIRGEGYFCIRTPEGEKLTRNGEYHINNQGVLVNNQGYPLMDINDQEIVIPLRDPDDPAVIIPYEQMNEQDFIYDQGFSVDSQGRIMQYNQYIATLKVVNVPDTELLDKQGDNFVLTEGGYDVLPTPAVVQGVKEASNVNAVKEMVDLISITRTYEACQKVVMAEDEITSTAIDSVGAVL